MKRLVCTICLLLIGGCSGTPGAIGSGWPIPAFVPIIDVTKVQKDKLYVASQIRTYLDGSNNYPEVEKSLGNITGYSVKHLLWEPSPTKENALIQLQLRAFDLGADGIINISFETGGFPEILTRDCWESIKVSGIAVKFKS